MFLLSTFVLLTPKLTGTTQTGQSCAACRLDPGAELIVLEKSGDVSSAACGMPCNLFCKDKPVEDLYTLGLDMTME